MRNVACSRSVPNSAPSPQLVRLLFRDAGVERHSLVLLIFNSKIAGTIRPMAPRACRRAMLTHIQWALLIATIAEASATGCGTPTQPMPWDGLVRVSGAVREFRTTDPVAGAHVTVGDYTGNPVTRENITATTDHNGNYSLTLPAGEQFLYVDGEWVGNPTFKDRTYRSDL